MSGIGAGIIGYGYWGPNVVRNFKSSGVLDVKTVCDALPAQLERVKKDHPDVGTTAQLSDLLGDASVSCVAIVTPVETHYKLAMAALEAGKHVWIEKPITASSEEAKRLVEAADKRGLTLFVDHTFVYTGAVRKLREIAASGELGAVQSYTSVRANLGLFRPDVNVMWDLAVHDVSIMDYAIAPKYLAVSATGGAHAKGYPENTAFLTMYLGDNAIAHVHVDWLTPIKIRQTIVAGDKKMVVYDDNEAVEKIRVHDRGFDLGAPPPGKTAPSITYRQGGVTAPALDKTEALCDAARHFAASISAGKKPITDGEFGLRVVRVLEAACVSLEKRGAPVEI